VSIQRCQDRCKNHNANVQAVHILYDSIEAKMEVTKSSERSGYQKKRQDSIGGSRLRTGHLVRNQCNRHGVGNVETNHVKKEEERVGNPHLVIGFYEFAEHSKDTQNGTETKKGHSLPQLELPRGPIRIAQHTGQGRYQLGKAGDCNKATECDTLGDSVILPFDSFTLDR